MIIYKKVHLNDSEFKMHVSHSYCTVNLLTHLSIGGGDENILQVIVNKH